MASAELTKLLNRLRFVVRGGDTRAFEALRGTHHVFGVDGLVIKLFGSHPRHEPEREWSGLLVAHEARIGPEPILFDADSDLPAVVMTRVPGSPRDAAALSADDLLALAGAHLALRAVAGDSPACNAVNHPAAALERVFRAWSDGLPDGVSEVVRVAWTRMGEWLESADAQRLVEAPRLEFCRGDPNLANYLFHGGDLRLVDFEDSGMNDPAFELADMAEHLNARGLPERAWEMLGDAFELSEADRDRFLLGRRLMAMFWLSILVRRAASGRVRGPETAEDQAGRVVALLDGSVTGL